MPMHLLPPALQKLLSYFLPVRIQRVHSAISGTMHIDLVNGRYQLYTGNAVYSYEDKYTSYATALRNADFDPNKPALVLGLGLGSIPFLLQSKHAYTGPITCIEIDPVIIDMAARYYPSAEGWKNIEVIQDDAISFLQHNTKKYALIAMDLFVGEEIPYPCWEKQFLINLKNSLSPGGTLLVSRLIERRMEEDSLWNNLEEIFPNSREIRTNGNMIMIWKHADNH
jgi:spermidine synthase